MKNLFFAVLVLLISCSELSNKTEVNTPHDQLISLFDTIEKFDESSEDSVSRGFHPKGAWSSIAESAQQQRADSLEKFIEHVKAIADASLDEQDRISKQLMIMDLQDQVDYIRFRMYLIPFNAEGGFYNSMGYSFSRLPFKTVDDYNGYLGWLPNYEKRLRENFDLLKQGVKDGIIAPKVIVNNTLALMKPYVVSDYKQLMFYTPLATLPESMNETDRQSVLQKAEAVVSSLQRTYQEIYDYIGSEYLQAAREQPGISFVPGGKAYYENRVHHFSTLPLTPDSVHNLGLAEVAGIRAAMEEIIKDVNFKGSFADFLKFLRTDPQFYAKTPQELLSYAAWLSKKAEAGLPKLFDKLYSLPFTVEPVPDAIAPTYTGGRYVPGSWDGKRAGIYWVNTYNLKSRTLYTLPALTLHEAVPGHHLQIMLAAELKDLPRFRTRYYISAFGEGWGLYSEYLGEEMGMYATPYDMFGRYTYEKWRACRLVVDTGIHYKGWTREQALSYLAENTAMSIHEVTTEIDRYIGWPGQALSYKIGEIKIKALRKKAEEALGDQFKIGAFHQAILQNGSVPLTVLEAQIDAYIEQTLKSEI
jgi:uncharacterized protein (DUF885 family)